MVISCVDGEAKEEESENRRETAAGGSNDFWVVGEDISEAEATILRLEARPGPHGTKYVWLDDLDPR